MLETNHCPPQRYVVVLTHGDSWGAVSANKIVKHLHEHHPDLGIYLVASTATKDEQGEIKTRLDDLKTFRALKETDLQTYFDDINQLYAQAPDLAALEQMLSGDCSPEDLTIDPLETGKQMGTIAFTPT